MTDLHMYPPVLRRHLYDTRDQLVNPGLIVLTSECVNVRSHKNDTMERVQK